MSARVSILVPEEEQADLVAAFADGEVGGAPAPIERFDTHLSHVFLSGERAFKLKRAISLPFVDFSSADLRRRACEAELAVNRAMAAPLYLGVEPIIRLVEGFRVGGAGAPVDWVVVMRRFETDQQFDRLAKAGKLTRTMIEEAVDIIAAAHGRAEASVSEGYAAHYLHVIRQLQRTEADGAARLGLLPAAPLLFERLEFELTRVSGLIEKRRREGKARRGHGDLHLRNLCLFGAEPVAFDALEFDVHLATTDVLYDLAFLLMDLRRVGLAGHANAAMNRYWDAAGEDEKALALLPFFMSLRAAVRMAVAVEAGDLGEADLYRRLGLALLEADAPRLVAIGGLSGTGKSAAARALAPCLPGPAGARLLRSDVLRKRVRGLEPDAPAGAVAYAPEARAETYRALAAHAADAVAAQASVIADATFRDPTARDALAQAAASAAFSAFWLSAPRDVRLARVAGRAGDASDADVAIAAAQEEPADLAAPWRRLDADRPVAAVAAAMLLDIEAAAMARGV